LVNGWAVPGPTAVSGFYFGHGDSRNFGVARIGRDQLEDYAKRRGVSLEEAERWLRPNLD
jgi:5-methyltetrahydrofolate--homocysteine methyltransferase